MKGYSRRAPQKRKPRNIALVVTEGKTERIYFEGFRERYSSVEIMAPHCRPTDAIGLVEHCCKLIPEKGLDIEDGDLAICAFDVDENPRDNVLEAMTLAEEHGIRIALSNPCFEVWLALHYQEVRYTLSRSEAIALMGKNIPGYSKTGDYNAVLGPLRSDGIERARSIKEHMNITRSIHYFDTNPSTSVHESVLALLELMQRNQKQAVPDPSAPRATRTTISGRGAFGPGSLK